MESLEYFEKAMPDFTYFYASVKARRGVFFNLPQMHTDFAMRGEMGFTQRVRDASCGMSLR